MSVTFEKIPHISLSYKLVPILDQEYEYGLLSTHSGNWWDKTFLNTIRWPITNWCNVNQYLYVHNTCLTLGTDERNDPISVTIVNTVVTPRATRAGIASFESQKLSQESTTIKNVGA